MNLNSIDTQIDRGAALAGRIGIPADSAANWLKYQAKPWLVARVSERVIPFIRRTGLKITRFERGNVEVQMPRKPNVNHIGTMYAGALFTLAEFPGGALFMSTFDMSKYIPIVTEMTIRFVAPAKGDVRLEISLTDAEIAAIEAEAEANGKAEFVLEGELVSVGDGTVVATSRGLYQVRLKNRAVPA